jgi:beta-lactam-binding protein with PASTA domain
MAFKFDINAIEAYVAEHARMFVTMVITLVVFVGVLALIVFFIALRGAEQAMVPDVRTKELTEALVELQAKELYPRIQMRYSQSVQDRGFVLEQDPRPGTIVKAGRRIRLVVSQGVMVNTIENYTGRNIEEVRMDLRALFASSSLSFLSVKEPYMYEYSPEPEGTILEQSPEPGTPVTGPEILEFVVSRGPEHVLIAVPALMGLSPAQALERVREAGLRFGFALRPVRQGERSGVVVYQDPAADAALESTKPVSILVTDPGELANGEVFGLFEYTLPENPVPLPVKLECLPPGGGSRITLAEADFAGGAFTFPYQAAPGSILIFSMLNRELYRQTVNPRLDELSLDEI